MHVISATLSDQKNPASHYSDLCYGQIIVLTLPQQPNHRAITAAPPFAWVITAPLMHVMDMHRRPKYVCQSSRTPVIKLAKSACLGIVWVHHGQYKLMAELLKTQSAMPAVAEAA